MDYRDAQRVLSDVVKLLREERLKNKITLKQLGAVSGVDRTTISRIEGGERSPTLLILLRIADGLGLRLADLLDSVEPLKKRR